MKITKKFGRIIEVVVFCFAFVVLEQTFFYASAMASEKHTLSDRESVLIEARQLLSANNDVSVHSVLRGVSIESRADTELDFSDPESGVFHLRYTGEKNAIQIWVTKVDSGEQVSYACPADGRWAGLPLPFGPGVYTVTSNPFDKDERISYSDDRVAFTLASTCADEAAPFRHANLYSDFDAEGLVVRMAQVIVAREEALLGRPLSDRERADAAVSFVYKNIINDGRIAELRKDPNADYYFPDIAMTLEEGKGTCADKTALAAAMLKSQGFPVRVHYGYIERAGSFGFETVYHAWLNVRLDGRWVLYDPSWFPGEVTNETAAGISYLFDTTMVR